jgi:hypothetical protein
MWIDVVTNFDYKDDPILQVHLRGFEQFCPLKCMQIVTSTI